MDRNKNELVAPAYSEQLCRDTAVVVGKPEAWGLGYYRHYASQGWVKGNGLPILDLRLHMAYLAAKGIDFAGEAPRSGPVRGKDGLTARERDIKETGR
jgi:hypothetical protein